MYKFFVSYFIPVNDALCCMNLEAEKVFVILILAKLGIMLL